ncbi:hypothetical protein FIBSPDRAFT_970804 [Athelia psychrophila]|uniref:Uncharacterized protein n=1 Tax=Athelia psychrophila TaxID=1759441 RepID=A0A167SHY4_9AGAM|nr:hypothetical protein FIBSPDRAFT_970804 [Fibularhizoctonia sp. CBS 109695]
MRTRAHLAIQSPFHSRTQLLLGGGPSLAGYEDLFDPQTYVDLDVQSGLKLEANIHNSIRVLAPEFSLLTLLDIEMCLPLPNALVDIWHANATRDYAGHPFPAS